MRDCPYKHKCFYYIGTPEHKCAYWNRGRNKCRVEFGKFYDRTSKGRQTSLR